MKAAFKAGSEKAEWDKAAIFVSQTQAAGLTGDQKKRKLTEKCQHEDPVVPDPELVSVAEVVPGWEVVILGGPVGKTHRETH